MIKSFGATVLLVVLGLLVAFIVLATLGLLLHAAGWAISQGWNLIG